MATKTTMHYLLASPWPVLELAALLVRLFPATDDKRSGPCESPRSRCSQVLVVVTVNC